MATLDDKLLGEKTHYYCSSSEDEGDRDEPRTSKAKRPVVKEAEPPKDMTHWSGNSANTGPKGNRTLDLFKNYYNGFMFFRSNQGLAKI